MRKSQLFTIQKQFHFTFYRNWIENTKQKPANVSEWKISEIKRLNIVCTRGDKSVYLWRRCVDDQIAMCRRRLLQRKQQSCYCTLTCNVWKKKFIREIVTKCLKSNEQKKKTESNLQILSRNTQRRKSKWHKSTAAFYFYFVKLFKCKKKQAKQPIVCGDRQNRLSSLYVQ